MKPCGSESRGGGASRDLGHMVVLEAEPVGADH